MICRMHNIPRRALLRSGLALPLWTLSDVHASDTAAAALRRGGVVVAMRHALAPGTFDPPGFALGNCGTQRNLNDEGQAQAQRIGQWFKRQGLKPARVRSSPWCRCVDTATLAFGGAESWSALGSPRGYTEQTSDQHLLQLREALAAAAAAPGRFEAWVTHMFVLSALVNQNTASGEGLVLRAASGGGVQVLARMAPA